jgi:serine/threonine-protein kinase
MTAVTLHSPARVASLFGVLDEWGTDRTFGERYQLGRVIGAGGMGIVYAGVQLSTGRDVAVKVLRREHFGNTSAKHRFLREARILGRFRGTHLPRLLDFGELEGGALFLALELVGGSNLRQVLAERWLRPAQAVDVVLQVCEAVSEAHALGIVHRDIKPENVMVSSRQGEVLDDVTVKLVDFGISKDPEADSSNHPCHYTLGCREYMAPEQYLAPDSVDPRADVWSLGLLLCELLCGELPTNRESHDETRPSRRLPPMPLGVAEGLERAISRCLEPRPEDRFPDARALARAVAPYATSGDEGRRGADRSPRTERSRHIPRHSGVFRVRGERGFDTLVESGRVAAPMA